MTKIAIIGGTGLTQLDGLQITKTETITTPYGSPSAPLTIGKMADTEVVFLPRHGDKHTIPPHKINYRANIHALKEAGVTTIYAVAAVGGITSNMQPQVIMIPDQVIDYSWGRTGTFYEEGLEEVVHIDFTHPYTPCARKKLLDAAKQTGVSVVDGGVYACTQGPRLETPAEINRLDRDGCHIVGMTGMPEASLAREAGIDYACCAVVANLAAGRFEGEITMEEIERHVKIGMDNVRVILQKALTGS